MRFLVPGVVLFALWLAFNHVRDKYRTCRTIGHGAAYCVLVYDPR